QGPRDHGDVGRTTTSGARGPGRTGLPAAPGPGHHPGAPQVGAERTDDAEHEGPEQGEEAEADDVEGELAHRPPSRWKVIVDRPIVRRSPSRSCSLPTWSPLR